jgi:CRISPR-associated protein Cas1
LNGIRIFFFRLLSQRTPMPVSQHDAAEHSKSQTKAANLVHDHQSGSVPDLIPARMLNEFSYCARLCYLEFVQGEWAENLDTLEGRFGHRRVDQPTRKSIPTGEGMVAAEALARQDKKPDPRPSTLDPQPIEHSEIHVRSLMLSSETEGLIAKLDLLELDGAAATPVDYKRGSDPKIDEGAYEPERVQLCAQALILRDNGFQCSQGVLYFIESKQRVVIEIDETLVNRTRELVQQLRSMAASGVTPPPLVDSPKCPRCSLVGICLPDEVNWLTRDLVEDVPNHKTDSARTNGSRPDGLRRIIPTRNDALPLYLQDHGLSLCKSGDQLTVKKKGEVIQKVKLKDVSQVCVFGSIHVTQPALQELITKNRPVCHFTYGGWFFGMTQGMAHKNIELRIRQFQIAQDQEQSLDLAKQLVWGKIKNSRTLLRRHLPKSGDRRVLQDLNDLAKKATQTDSVASLLGIEGMAAKHYFAGFKRLLKEDSGFDLEGRNRRPPKDPVNAMLSFLYAILAKELTIAVSSVGFDSMLGFYHQPRYGKPALALDLAEEFRSLLVDSTVLMLINNGEVSDSDFINQAGASTLTSRGRKQVLAAFERRMNSEVTHPIFRYRISYRRILEVQARLLARTVLGELDEYPAFCTR